MSAKKEMINSTNNKRSKSLFSWMSSKSLQSASETTTSSSTPTKTKTSTNDSSIERSPATSPRTPRGKAERFSFTQVSQQQDAAHDPLSLRKSLEEGLKASIRVENTKNCFGFDNCIMWLKGGVLEIWKPSAGENIILPLSDISSIRANNEEILLFLKLNNELEYAIKLSDQARLQQLRLLLKASAAQTIVTTVSSTSNHQTTLSKQTSVANITPSPSVTQTTTEDDSSSNENVDSNNVSMESSRKKIAASTQRISLRLPNLTSPVCAQDRAGARQRLRSRSNISISAPTPTPTPTTTSTPLKPETVVDNDQSEDEIFDTLQTTKHSPKRTREDLENEENNETVGNSLVELGCMKSASSPSRSSLSSTTSSANAETPNRFTHEQCSPSKRSKAIHDCDVIISSETISL